MREWEIKFLKDEVERLRTELRSLRSDLFEVALAVGQVRGDVRDLAARTEKQPR